MRTPLLALFLAVTATFVAAQGNESEATEAKAVVSNLYRKVVARHPLGVSVGGELKVFAPYLSKALLHKIDVANACVDDWFRQHPDPNMKPPGLEDGLFTGDDLRAEPHAFSIEQAQATEGRFIRVSVKLTHNEPGETTWTWRVAAILTRENGHFVVDDVVYIRDSPQDVDSRLSKYLSQGYDGPHWVGRNEAK